MRVQNCIAMVFVILCLGCGDGNKQPNRIINEDFNEFYNKFYSDSIFQMSRIVFPLKGKHCLDGCLPESPVATEWSKNEWSFLQAADEVNDSIIRYGDYVYRREIKKSDTLVVERIYIPDSGFEILAKYSLKEQKWYLVYYSEANY
ncbi:MAG TPA: hypothetical protein PKY76_11230 [Bacteroidales bacterium]|nr:hypothetical protein [Bacteroidales bacterium]